MWFPEVWFRCGSRRYGLDVVPGGMVSMWFQEVWFRCGSRRYGLDVVPGGMV